MCHPAGWRSGHRRDVERGEEGADAVGDVVADGADGVEVLAGGVVELPVFVAFAGEVGAGVAAAHGDHDVGGADDLVGPGLGVFAGDVDADLGHGGDGGRVDLAAGFGAAGPGDRFAAGEVVEPAEGHLGATGVVDAEEQDDGDALVGFALDLGESLEALAGEALGEQRQERRDAGAAGELLVAGLEEQLDGLNRERALVLAGEVLGRCLQCQALVRAQGFEVGHRGPPPTRGRERGTGHEPYRPRAARR